MSRHAYVNARVIVTDRLLGGLVFVDNLHRDPSGRLFVNLEKFDVNAQGIDQVFLQGQPKVQVSLQVIVQFEVFIAWFQVQWEMCPKNGDV